MKSVIDQFFAIRGTRLFNCMIYKTRSTNVPSIPSRASLINVSEVPDLPSMPNYPQSAVGNGVQDQLDQLGREGSFIYWNVSMYDSLFFSPPSSKFFSSKSLFMIKFWWNLIYILDKSTSLYPCTAAFFRFSSRRFVNWACGGEAFAAVRVESGGASAWMLSTIKEVPQWRIIGGHVCQKLYLQIEPFEILFKINISQNHGRTT